MYAGIANKKYDSKPNNYYCFAKSITNIVASEFCVHKVDRTQNPWLSTLEVAILLRRTKLEIERLYL